MPKDKMKIFMVTREYEGIAGAGGVKDVSRQLAEALVRKGLKAGVVLPLYSFFDPASWGFEKKPALTMDIDMPYVGRERRETVVIWAGCKNGVNIYLVDAARYREKAGIYTYTAEEEEADPSHHQGSGHYDYFAMNVLLQKTALALLIYRNEKPNIIHCQDGHTATLPALVREKEGYRHYFRKTGFVTTVHNAGVGYHQEVGDLPFAEVITGLPSRIILASLLNGHFDPFMACSSYSVMNTVSENYARELMNTDDDALTGWLGHRLKSKGITLEGVTNGINPDDFDPANHEKLGIAAPFSPARGDFLGKKKCRAEIVSLIGNKKFTGLKQTGTLADEPSQPLYTFIGRFSPQKGVDKMIGALEALLPMDDKFQVLILGSGTRDIEADLIKLARIARYKGRICILRGYDSKVANKVYAAGDFFLIPSQYEPCGLTDFMAQLMGNIPIVHHVGGLVKVEDGITGLAYKDHNSAALMGAMLKGLQLYRERPEKIDEIRKNAVRKINKNFTWDRIVERYDTLYKKALAMTRR